MLDIIIITLVLGFAAAGFGLGLVHTLGSLLGTILGAFVASFAYNPITQWFLGKYEWDENTTIVIVFIVLFLLVNRLITLIFWLLKKFTNLITWVPGINVLNRLGGFCIGFIEGIISLALIIYFFDQFPFSETLSTWMKDSRIVPIMLYVVSFITPFLPQITEVTENIKEVAKQG